MPLASPIELPERYRVARHIASGGMASVWEVEDLLLGRIVAVKVLGPQFAADRGARARFQREARTAAQVSAHPHVVTIYDIGEHRDDAFIVMEHFSGGTVADRLREARTSGRRVDRETALRWLREAAAGLDVAHAAGIVHRDVKPANLLLDAQGRLAVADFGIARLADDTQMTQTGQVLGTAAYLSPEQATGQPATPASDRYALAVVAYELLSGRRPFGGGAPAAQLLQHAEERPPRASEAAPELPSAVDSVLGRGLAKDPAARPATATRFVDELGRALAGEAPVESTRPLPAVAAAAPEPAVAPKPAATPKPVATPKPTAIPKPAGTPARQPEPARAAVPRPAQPPSAPRPQPAPGRSRDHRLPALAALAITAVLVGGVVGLTLRGDNGADRSSSAGRSTTQSAAARERDRTTTGSEGERAAAAGEAQQTQPDRAQQTQPNPAPPSTPAQTSDPAALNNRGYERIQAGDYAGAVEPLRAAVRGYRDAGRTGELNYYFALYNLAVALARSGDPAGAIPILRERLRNPNQRVTVQRELDKAQAQVGDGKPGKKDEEQPGYEPEALGRTGQ